MQCDAFFDGAMQAGCLENTELFDKSTFFVLA